MNPTIVELEAPEAGGLLRRAQDGDAEAFGEICRVHETRLLRQAMTLCGNAAHAEDLAQDTLVEAWRSLHRYHGGCQFYTWLCAILLNRHRSFARKKRATPFSFFTGSDQLRDALGRLRDEHSAPDEASELREQSALMQTCIRALPAKHQQVIYLRFYVDDSLEGIAAALGCSVGTVKSRLFHAPEKLRRMKARNRNHQNSSRAGILPALNVHMKPCRKYRKQVVWLAAAALADGEARALRAHLETCAGCRAYLAEISHVTERLAAAGAIRKSARLNGFTRLWRVAC